MVNVDTADIPPASPAAATAAATQRRPQQRRARIALIGTGGRSEMYIRAVLGTHSDTAELVALSDVNPGRVDYYQKLIGELGGTGPVGSFDPTKLTAFIKENGIDRVIVTTPDF